MLFKKLQDGLLESQAYHNFVSIAGLLTSAQWANTGGKLILYKGNVERVFEESNFVILIEKVNTPLQNDNRIQFYVDGDSGKCGIEETQGQTSLAWKLVMADGYLQAYHTFDGAEWQNIGGLAYTGVEKHGLVVFGNQPLEITRYVVYKNPFLTIQNYPFGTVAKLRDSNGVTIAENTFDINSQCQIFLHNEVIGKLSFYSGNSLIFETQTLEFKPGDVWGLVPYELELIYQGDILDWRTANLAELQDVVTIKNISISEYTNIKIEVANNLDVQISLDNAVFSDSLTITQIQPNESKDIYIKIQKPSGVMFDVKNFELIIGE